MANEDPNELRQVIQKFWETEAIGIKERNEHDELNFVSDIQLKDGRGRYEVSLF